jgi:GTP pyrophosphokinase/guanosine-3',5'-bis(diphosphate) 3'-pyrophosphohydrolase
LPLKRIKIKKELQGDPYSVHPIEVANILTELKLDSATITTGLLHDTIEDTFATYETIKNEFGDEVADLVNGVTKISVFENTAGSNSKVENFRKLILATSKDIRVLLVKIADRLHNMRTIKAIPKIEKRQRIAQETMEIYAPLADRMGMHRIRDELEDLSFEILNNDARELIKKKLDEIKSDKKDLFESLSFELSEILNDNHINAEIHGREKTPFSIWRKVQKKRISLEQITDIIGFRITVSTVDECYKTLGIFHKRWNCIPGKFKDYISSPKINGYKSLHTSVIGSNKKPIEIQIRTHEMHEFAERGVASHWKYKSSEKFNSLSWKEYDWLKDLVEIIERNENPEHSYEYTKLQMFQENVFCFTPKGSVIKLPKDATPIDFAYAVHTKIGNTAIGCEINGNKSDLQELLRNGDRVNIITSKNQSPSLHWIPTTKTGKARAAIRRYWHDKGEQKEEKAKKYNTTLWISLPDQPGQLGDISSLIGSHKLNISNVEMAGKNTKYINFKFRLIITNLKNFTNFIAELKQKSIKFKIIRHEDKRNAFTQKILKYFKKTDALLEGHFVLSSGLHSSKYIQCAKLLSFPHLAESICKSLAKKIKKKYKKIDLILAPAMGGVVIGYEIGKLLKKETIFCERVNGKFKLRRGFNIKNGSKVLIIEDVITTGKSSLECVKLIKKANAKLLGFASIIDRSTKKSLKIKTGIISHLKIDVPTFTAKQLPQDLKSIPITTPGSRFIK